MVQRYRFAFDDRFKGVLRLLGVTPDRPHVEVSDRVFEAQFGPWLVRTPLSNVDEATVTGPHRAIKAIGPRFSPSTRSLTFGTNAERTVRVRFRRPVRGMEPLGIVRHPVLSVSVADPEELRSRLALLSAQRQ